MCARACADAVLDSVVQFRDVHLSLLDGVTISIVYIAAIGKPWVEQDVNNKLYPAGVNDTKTKRR